MNGVISNVQISCPPVKESVDALASLYGALLGMPRIHIGYTKLVHADGHRPEIGFETWTEDQPPRWPDPDYPQQAHLDIEVGDLDAAEEVAQQHGATRLRHDGSYRILADPVGHPFCLYENPARPPRPGRMARVVFDCFSPRALAPFYEALLDMQPRVFDSPERVVIAGAAGGETMLAFQHAQFRAARWPDPAYPEQLHLDLTIDDAGAVARVEELGGIRLHLAERPDALVYADPAAHPFCLEVGPTDGPSGPGQVEAFAAWLAAAPVDDVLRAAHRVLVVDWPSRDVPDTLARAGYEVHVHGGPAPDDYSVYRWGGEAVVVERTGQAPVGVDLVYTHRPLDELPGIVETAQRLGAVVVWAQSGFTPDGRRDPKGCWLPATESRQARALVESAGLTYVDDRYLPDEVRRLGLGLGPS
ncbi:MAG: VOC family protein [Acidimicrobiales bacterium]